MIMPLNDGYHCTKFFSSVKLESSDQRLLQTGYPPMIRSRFVLHWGVRPNSGNQGTDLSEFVIRGW